MIAGGSYADAFGTSALTASTWAFLTETYDGSTLRLYVNGTQVASTAHTGAISTSTNPLQIGGDSLYGQFFAGLIDNVRVYNVALSAAQIQTDRRPRSPRARTRPLRRSRGRCPRLPCRAARSISPGARRPTTSASRATTSSAARARAARNFAQIATTTGTGTSYKDTSVSASTSYSYRVRATDAAGNLSTYSNTAGATTPDAGHDPAVAAGDAERDCGVGR